MKYVLVYGMTSNPGGIESYLLNLLKCTKKYGVQLDFVTDFPSIAYEKEIREYQGKIYYINRKGKKLIKHWREFYKIFKKHPEYSTVYFNALDAGVLFTAVIPWLLKRKVVIHSHNGETSKRMLQTVTRPLLGLITDKRVACSRLAAEFMFGKKASKEVLIVPNAITLDKYQFKQEIRENIRKKMGIEKKIVLCHIGRLSEQKNPFRLLEILVAVLKKEKNVVLLSVGTGELEDEVHDYARKLGVEDHVKFLGKRNDVSDLLQAADVFVLPSKYEGLPIVAIEAQAAGIPSVLSSAISSETNISGKIEFVDLQEKDEKWADIILMSAKRERYCCIEKLKEKGYDSSDVSEQTRQLIAILKR